MSEISKEVQSSIALILDRYLTSGEFIKPDQEEALSSLLQRSSSVNKSKDKNYTNLFNEYENEKYKPALESLKKRLDKNDSEILDIVIEENPTIMIRVFGNYYETNSRTAHKFYVDVIELVFNKLPTNSYPLIELGAGEGATLLPLYQRIYNMVSKCLAIDLSPSGLNKLTTIGKQFGLDVSTMTLNVEEVLSEDIKEYSDGIVLTSFFITCLPGLKKDYFQQIANLNPRYVLHFEPNYEKLDESKLQDAICRDYVDKNNYNESFETELRKFLLDAHSYEIFLEVEDVFGKNALLPSSIIGWKLKTAR